MSSAAFIFVKLYFYC